MPPVSAPFRWTCTQTPSQHNKPSATNSTTANMYHGSHSDPATMEPILLLVLQVAAPVSAVRATTTSAPARRSDGSAHRHRPSTTSRQLQTPLRQTCTAGLTATQLRWNLSCCSCCRSPHLSPLCGPPPQARQRAVPMDLHTDTVPAQQAVSYKLHYGKHVPRVSQRPSYDGTYRAARAAGRRTCLRCAGHHLGCWSRSVPRQGAPSETLPPKTG